MAGQITDRWTVLANYTWLDSENVTEDAELTQARLLLVNAAQTVLRSGLDLLGVSAPLKM